MLSFGIIVLFEVSKLSFTGLIKMILKGKKLKLIMVLLFSDQRWW